MQTDVITVDPGAALLDVHRLFLEEEINGAPVVDEQGVVHGVISSLDLVRVVEEEYLGRSGATIPVFLRDELAYSGPDWLQMPEDYQDRMAKLTAADAMVTEVVSVSPEAPISEVARTMREQRIHRVLVIKGGMLTGILSTFDLIKLLE